jgi:hypothetical protein
MAGVTGSSSVDVDKVFEDIGEVFDKGVTRRIDSTRGTGLIVESAID